MKKREKDGTKKKGKKKWIIIGVIVVLLIIIIAAAASSGDSEPKKVESNTTTETQKKEDKQSDNNKKSTFSIGDTAELNGVRVTLSKAVFSNGEQYDEPESGHYYLGLKFKIKNNSSEEVNVSSIASFDAYYDSEAVNETGSSIPELKGKSLDGTLAPGKKITGVMVYEVPKKFKKFEIRYTPDELNGKDIIYRFSRKKVDASAVE